MATAFKVQKNGAVSTLGATMTTVATTITLATGTGTKFPAVSGGGYWVTVWGAAITNPLNDTNMEICLVTAITTDTLTVTRSQLGTNSGATFTHATSDNIQLLIQDQNFTDVHTAINNLENSTTGFDGWYASEVWTFVSASTFTIVGDVTAKYAIGDKIKWMQSGIQNYAYIIGTSFLTPNTTVTITGGIDYSLSGAAVTNTAYSKGASPANFPAWFNYTPAWSGFSTNPSVVSKFTLDSRLVTVYQYVTGNGTSNATGFTTTAPVISANQGRVVRVVCAVLDNSANQSTPGMATIGQNTNSIVMCKTTDPNTSSNWTASLAKGASFTLMYDI